MTQAINEGLPKLRIEEAAARTRPASTPVMALVGVNKYRPAQDEEIDILKVVQFKVRAEQLDKLARLRADRDQAAVDSALANLTRAAGESGGSDHRQQPDGTGHRCGAPRCHRR